MNIILLKDVERLGYSDDVVEVKPGYARNYLIPQGKAVVANKENLAKLEERLSVRKAEEEKLAAQVQQVVEAVEKAKIAIATKIGTSGKLFGSVTNLQLSEALKEATGFEIDRRKIAILDEISEVGTYKAEISLPQETKTTFEFDVVSE